MRPDGALVFSRLHPTGDRYVAMTRATRQLVILTSPAGSWQTFVNDDQPDPQ